MSSPFYQQIGADFATFQQLAENPHPMLSQQPYPPHQLHQPPFQAQTPHPLVSNETVSSQGSPQTAPELTMNLNQAMVDLEGSGFASGALSGAPSNDLSGGVLGLTSSPEALMNALNLLQQNISALQSLIPLMAQQQQQQPVDSAHAEQLKQQHAAASAGIASVISQLALAAANILPQMGLPVSVNVTSATIPPANVTSGAFQSGNEVLQGTPASFDFHNLGFQMLESKSRNVRNDDTATAQVQLSLASLTPAAAEFVKLQQLKSVISQKEQQQHQQLIQQQTTVSPGDDTSPLAIASHLPRKRKKLEPVTMTPAADVRQGNPAIFPPGDDGDDDEGELLAGEFNIVQMDPVELLAEHTHFCEICGKGFKRDANLRMHMRGHGDEYKTPEALANPDKTSLSRTNPTAAAEKKPLRYSCPFFGCKRNQQHRAFVPLKTMLCVKNHYRRTHCPKMLSCSKCGAKRFSVVADLKTHEKHCGRDRWLCSCGTSFSRKDKLLGHLALFKGHRPANPSLTAADDGAAGAKPILAASSPTVAAPPDDYAAYALGVKAGAAAATAAVSPMLFGASFQQPEQQPGYHPGSQPEEQPEQQPGYQPEQRALVDLVTADLLGSAEKAARLVL